MSDPHAPGSSDPPAVKPYIPADQVVPEFTAKAIVLGSIFGIIFGAATVYLALKAGLTVSASIPIAVLSIAVFKRLGKSTILENNIVQTIGSAGESIAAGVVFTLPALLFLSGGEQYFRYFQIMILAAVGGILGVLFMVPLRRSLIVKEHGKLPYPEGTACAEVLIVGERGGNLAKRVFAGVYTAIGYKLLMGVFGLWKETPTFQTKPTAAYPNATVSGEITPEYLGVGYIIGPRIASEMVSGGVLSWLVLIPLISLFVPEAQRLADLHALGFDDKWIANHGVAEHIYRAYIRYIGAGAVACAGMITLIKTIPTIVASFRDSIRDLRGGQGGSASRLRTERDMPISVVIVGALALVLILALLPSLPGSFPGSLLMALLVVVFGFFFVTVSSRIVGIIGSSSNPISGMTIATLMGTCLIFVSLKWTSDAHQSVALMVGAIVCIAAANAGATSQDLKTGYLVGATPIKQQIGLVIGVLVSVAVIGGTLLLLDRSVPGELHGIGSAKMPAPQGTLMATIIKALLAQKLPWGPVLVGMFAALMAQLAGAHALSWAVGAYLPISTTAPIWVGGLMKAVADRRRKAPEEGEVGPGMLYATGLVAGGSLAGIAIALLIGFGGSLAKSLDLGHHYYERLGLGGDGIALGAFALLCVLLVRQALSRQES
ncbi:MAG: oligopeptide transporter, OPT family [Deltaproteobacteria bacterium]|nr:oligopeptide transporter, OPT family [Deltaproteobacteria bacterium]